jgi:hypothetical protein
MRAIKNGRLCVQGAARGNEMSRAETALSHIDLMTDDIFNAHDELESRTGGPGESVNVNGIPTLLYRFSDCSALTLSAHTDYAGNIHVWRKDNFPTLDAHRPRR